MPSRITDLMLPIVYMQTQLSNSIPAEIRGHNGSEGIPGPACDRNVRAPRMRCAHASAALLRGCPGKLAVRSLSEKSSDDLLGRIHTATVASTDRGYCLFKWQRNQLNTVDVAFQ
jgi:hypothetical protein